MSQRVAKFDPSVGSGDCTIGAINRCSKIWVVNESPNFITLDFGGAASTEDLQPFYNQLITLPQPVNMAHWTVTDTLQSGSSPVSLVMIRLYQPAEDTSSLLSGPIPRLLNVGNAAAVSASANAVQNDGNVAGTTVVEGTPSGAGSSQLLLTNDGKATLGGGNVALDATGKFTKLPAGAVPVASIGAGALPSGVTVPGGQVTGAIPASQVGSGYPASSLSGAVPTAQNLADMSMGIEGSPPLVIGRTTVGDDFVLQTNDGVTSRNFTFGKNGDFSMQYGQINFAGGANISGISGFGGSGSATVNHGLGSTPRAVCANTFNGSNSTTFGSGSYTSTTCYIYQFNSQPWVAIAYV